MIALSQKRIFLAATTAISWERISAIVVSSTSTGVDGGILLRRTSSFSNTSNNKRPRALMMATVATGSQNKPENLGDAVEEEEGFVALDDGTELPYTRQRNSPLNLIVAHGLGSDPAEKTHKNDISSVLWEDCRRHLRLPSASSRPRSSIFGAEENCTILYTARGHGSSTGWDRQAMDMARSRRRTRLDYIDKLLAEPFRWPELAADMLAVADRTGLAGKQFAVFGQSMGAASALYLAMSEEGRGRVKALVLARPPRMGKARREASADYEIAAEAYRQQNPSSYRYLTILGAAITDLPDHRRDVEEYRKITAPVLILCHGMDEAHPVLSGQLLAEAMPHATLYWTASDEDEARATWPKFIAEWLTEQGLVGDG